MSIFAWIVVIIVVVVVSFGITSYNRLVAMRQQCNQAFADIDVQLRQRHDLVPNLVETVKAYAGHERGTLDAVVEARNAAAAAQEPAIKAQAETKLTGALRQLFAVAESYPNLKASSNFQGLQAELTAIENKIATARRSFNGMVQQYNSMIQQFPTAVFARSLGFTPHEFFNLGDDGGAAAPQVTF